MHKGQKLKLAHNLLLNFGNRNKKRCDGKSQNQTAKLMTSNIIAYFMQNHYIDE